MTIKLIKIDPKRFKVSCNKKIKDFFNLQFDNLATATKKYSENDDGFGYGLYFIFHKERLIYIGKYCGFKKNVAHERLYKHLASLTNRFEILNFVGASKEKFYNKKFTFTKLLRKQRKELSSDQLAINEINKHIKEKQNKFITKYEKIKNKEIYTDTLKVLKEISIKDPVNRIQMLTSEGKNQTKNRLKFASLHWDEFKKADAKDIFNNFECYYLKFTKYNKSNKSKKFDSDFGKKYEKKCIENFWPFANKENFESYTVVDPLKNNIKDIIKEIKKYNNV